MSGGGRAFLGTACISSGTLEHLVIEIVEEYKLQGIRRFLILNGHSENDSALLSAINRVVSKNEGVRAIVVNWWNMLSSNFVDEHIPKEAHSFLGGRSSYLETLTLLGVRPDLVHLGELAASTPIREVKYEMLPINPEIMPPSDVIWPNDQNLKASLTTELANLVFVEILRNTIESINKDLPIYKKR
jgi:creatinine amidohydrolase